MFDLDNTLIDFLKMKRLSCDAAIDAMIGSGLKVNHDKASRILFGLYGKYGMEDKLIFQKFLQEIAGEIDPQRTSQIF